MSAVGIGIRGNPISGVEISRLQNPRNGIGPSQGTGSKELANVVPEQRYVGLGSAYLDAAGNDRGQ